MIPEMDDSDGNQASSKQRHCSTSSLHLAAPPTFPILSLAGYYPSSSVSCDCWGTCPQTWQLKATEVFLSHPQRPEVLNLRYCLADRLSCAHMHPLVLAFPEPRDCPQFLAYGQIIPPRPRWPLSFLLSFPVI